MRERLVRYTLLCSLIFLACEVSAAASQAEEPAKDAPKGEKKITMGMALDYNSRYIYRGYAYSEGPVLQPSVSLTINEFTFSSFGNYVLGNEPQQGQINEVDIYLTWSRTWEKITIEPSLNLYTSPNVPDSNSTFETSLSLSRDFGNFRVSTSHSADFVDGSSATYYGDLGLSHTLEVRPGLSLKTCAAFAWPEPLIALDAALTYYLTKNVYLYPHIGISTIFKNSLSDSLEECLTAYGIGTGVEF